MFKNPMPKPSCQKSRKTIITPKVLVTQSSNIVYCDWHTQKLIYADFQVFSYTFPLFKLMGFFFHFLLGEFWKQPKISHFCWLLLRKMHPNGMSGMYLGFEMCQIQWQRFQISMISGPLKINTSGKNFTFCWFWLGKCIKMAWVVHI